MEDFSTRNGIEIAPVEISYWDEAPKYLRLFICEKLIEYYHCAGYKSIKELNNHICVVTRVEPDGNWGDDFLKSEIEKNICEAQWNYVYDIIEDFVKRLKSPSREELMKKIDDFLLESGGGWQFDCDGKLVRRGNLSLEVLRKSAPECECGRDAKTEIEEAVKDISRRPVPDYSGAIHHSMVAIECFCRKMCCTRDPLGKLLQKNRGVVPSPLNEAVEKLWGFASERGRHIAEGKYPELAEAEFLVHISAALIFYLEKKKLDNKLEELPF